MYIQYTIAISKKRGNDFEEEQEYMEQAGGKKRRG